MTDQDDLPALPGTAPDGSWRIGTIDSHDADGRLAIFAIVKRPSSSPLDFRGTGEGDLIGTGFFVVPDGGFVTAKHVASEAQQAISESPNSVGILYALLNGLFVFRPIARLHCHPVADVAFGIPHELFDKTTGIAYRAKVLSLDCEPPAIWARISTWAYPLHFKVRDLEGKDTLQVQPAFYDGVLQEFHSERGPSGKLNPPYYQTNVHLHGGSSGGPVFNQRGRVFGVASSSFAGAVDIAFVTPIGAVFEIELPDTNLRDGRGSRNVTVREIANIGQIIDREI